MINSYLIMVQFEIGKTYGCRSICDSDCIFSYTILGRTAKMVVIYSPIARKARKCKVREYDGAETIYPEGYYSMCPIIRADRLIW